MGKILETAQFWSNLGIGVIPIEYKTKKPKIPWLPYTERLATNSEISTWFASDMTNIAVISGWKNLCIIDFDDMEVFMQWRYWAIEQGGKAKSIAMNTRMHRSARGMHVFILSETADNMKLPKIDVLANHKYALLPPSIHPSGTLYQIYRDSLPMSVNNLYDVLPKRLLDDALMKKAQSIAGPAPRVPSIPSDVVIDSVNYDPWEVASVGINCNVNLVKRIKAQIPITSIMHNQVWKNSGENGRWKVTRCPFHDDKNPSFWLDSVNNICGCHAGCTPLPLDVIDLYARLNGVDNWTAIKELAKKL